MNPKINNGGIKKQGWKFFVVETPTILIDIGEVELHHKTETFKRDISGRFTVVPICNIPEYDRFSVSVNMPDKIWTESNYNKHFHKIATYIKT